MLSGFVISHVYHGLRKAGDQPVLPGFSQGEGGADLSSAPDGVVAVCGDDAGGAALRLLPDRRIAADRSRWSESGPFGGFFANLLMLQGIWARELSWNDPAWSISLEFLAYLCFRCCFRRSGGPLPSSKPAPPGLLLIVLGWLAYSTGDDFNQWNGIAAIMRCLPEFLIGALLYSAYRRRSARHGAGDRRRAADRNVVALRAAHFAGPDLSILPLFALLILTAVSKSRPARFRC